MSEGHASAVRILREVPQTDLMDSTRRYSRSLAESFADVRAPAIEIHRPVSHTLRDVLLAVVVGIAIAATLVAWWST